MLTLALALLLAPSDYGVARLKQVLPESVRLVTAIGAACPQRVPGGPEALSISKTAKQLTLCGSDSTGLMYAALDTAERISWAAGQSDPLRFVRDTSEQPDIAERAISIYTMQRALFEQRLHDRRHWERYFDLLAASRINSFVVIFGYENGGFMAPLYPFFFDTPGFAGVRLTGITPAEQKRNTEAFRAMIRMAHARGIRVTAGIWDHIYRGGVQGGGIAGASENAGKAVPHLVTGLDADNLAGYTKAALRSFLDVFPELDGIQFRMHDESGLKPSEMETFWHEVFALIQQKRPGLQLDLRAKGLPDAVIADALSQGLRVRVNTKYWMEQTGLPYHPTHVNTENQHDRRHGYADLLQYPQRYQMIWQLWTAGTTRLLLWGDPEYVRRFSASAHLYGSSSIEINEMLATWMLGSPHDEKPGAIHTPGYRFYDYPFERYWLFYRLWGRVSYNPQCPPETWEREFVRRFNADSAPHLMNGVRLASQVLPHIVAAAYRYQNFPTTRGWAEMMRQDALPKFADLQGSDIEQFMNPRDEARRMLSGGQTALRRPAESAAWFARTSRAILEEVAAAEKTMGGAAGKELTTTVTDLRILAGLAGYYAARLPAAVSYNLYLETRNLEALDAAIAGEKAAVEAWRGIASAAAGVYSEDLAFGVHRVGFPRSWKEELGKLERDFAELLSARAQARPDGAARALPPPAAYTVPPPPAVEILPSGQATEGEDYVVTVRAADPAAIQTLRLRYRHVTQYEDYLSAAMTAGADGVYQARIPGAFVTAKWDLMFFVEAIGRNGGGRVYPDLEAGTPWVLAPVKRKFTAAASK